MSVSRPVSLAAPSSLARGTTRAASGVVVAALAAALVACFPSLPPEADDDTAQPEDTAQPPEDTAQPPEDTAQPPDDDTAQPPGDTLQPPDDTSDDTSDDTTEPPTCDPPCAAPGDPCKVARCDDGACVVDNAPNGTPCDDGLYCTVDDSCVGGACLGAPRGCDDGVACTVDTCDDDADTCRHDGGACECGPGVSCDDGEACNGVETCDLTTWQCVAGTPLADNLPCNDGLVCTVDDRCEGGVCKGAARDCDDAIACTVDDCSETAGGCVNDSSACSCLNNSDCPDNNLCDGTSTCDVGEGVCDPGTPVVCEPSDTPCKVVSCAPSTGACLTTDAAPQTPCDDGNPCTDNDACASGACVPGAALTGPTCEGPAGAVWSCVAGQCAAPTCDDGLKNGAETDVDCGGPDCDPCALGEACAGASDCASDACDAGTCAVAPTGFVCTGHVCANDTTGEVWVPPGTFWMGCNDFLDPYCPDQPAQELQQHVTLSGYSIDRNAVTKGAYQACAAAGACTAEVTSPSDHPVETSWANAATYCAWAGKSAGAQALCTEAQWARAARGGCETLGDAGLVPETCRRAMRTYPWGEAPHSCEYAVLDDEQLGPGCGIGVHPVGSKPAGASPYGALDMVGNVAEWVKDFYSYPFADGPVTDPQGPASGTQRVVRSCSYIQGLDHRAHLATAATRANAFDMNEPFGFRCCRSSQ